MGSGRSLRTPGSTSWVKQQPHPLNDFLQQTTQIHAEIRRISSFPMMADGSLGRYSVSDSGDTVLILIWAERCHLKEVDQGHSFMVKETTCTSAEHRACWAFSLMSLLIPYQCEDCSPCHWLDLKSSESHACPAVCDLLCPWDSPGKNSGVGCHALLQEIFLTQESNPGLLRCRQILYHLSHQGSPVRNTSV